MSNQTLTYTKLHLNLDCDCIINAMSDTISNFGRKTNKSSLRINDFKSNWEKNGSEEDGNCKRKCSHRSISLSKITVENKELVLDVFRETFRIAPSYKPYINIIKLKETAGVVKKSPSRNNPHHYDFFKCDTFALTDVETIEVIQL